MIPKVVIIEDNVQLIEYIKEFLKTNAEFNVIGFTSGLEALKYLKSEKPDIVIIDLQLEDVHGETICKEIRKNYLDIPIIILTGDKSHSSIVSCLNSGADDYITKPFDSEEFLARIRARLRFNLTKSTTNLLTNKDLILNTDTLEVFIKDQKIDFTAKEFELLKYLLINKFRVSTRDKILFSVWDHATDVDTRVVDVHIGKLRKKLEKYGAKNYIESVRGYGYKLVTD
jgi:DNA-binding response OmpR family regulator